MKVPKIPKKPKFSTLASMADFELDSMDNDDIFTDDFYNTVKEQLKKRNYPGTSSQD